MEGEGVAGEGAVAMPGRQDAALETSAAKNVSPEAATTIDPVALLRADGDAVTAQLKALKTRYKDVPSRLAESIEYSLLAGGKRLRPALVLETCRACGGGGADGSTPNRS